MNKKNYIHQNKKDLKNQKKKIKNAKEFENKRIINEKKCIEIMSPFT